MTELHTTTSALKRMRQMKSALQECEEYFEPLATGEWLADGPHGNREMQLLVEVQQVLASCDTHPKDGDVEQAPLVSGAVTNEVRQTPIPDHSSETPVE